MLPSVLRPDDAQLAVDLRRGRSGSQLDDLDWPLIVSKDALAEASLHSLFSGVSRFWGAWMQDAIRNDHAGVR
jgi:hypothetical protein